MTSLGDDAAPPSSVLLKARPGDDVRRDGLARELREDERRGVHRGVIVPQGRELRTFCGIVFWRKSGGKRVSHSPVVRSSRQLVFARGSTRARVLGSLRQNKTRQRRSSDILKLYRYFSSSPDAAGRGAEREASVLAGRRRGKRKPTAASGSLARRLAPRRQPRERAFSGWFAFWDSLFGVERFTHPAPGAGPCWVA